MLCNGCKAKQCKFKRSNAKQSNANTKQSNATRSKSHKVPKYSQLSKTCLFEGGAKTNNYGSAARARADRGSDPPENRTKRLANQHTTKAQSPSWKSALNCHNPNPGSHGRRPKFIGKSLETYWKMFGHCWVILMVCLWKRYA